MNKVFLKLLGQPSSTYLVLRLLLFINNFTDPGFFCLQEEMY